MPLPQATGLERPPPTYGFDRTVLPLAAERNVGMYSEEELDCNIEWVRAGSH